MVKITSGNMILLCRKTMENLVSFELTARIQAILIVLKHFKSTFNLMDEDINFVCTKRYRFLKFCFAHLSVVHHHLVILPALCVVLSVQSI